MSEDQGDITLTGTKRDDRGREQSGRLQPHEFLSHHPGEEKGQMRKRYH